MNLSRRALSVHSVVVFCLISGNVILTLELRLGGRLN